MIVQTIVGAVLFFAASCPAPGFENRAGCTIPEATPVVYVRQDMPRPLRRFIWWHELGHVWALRTPGAPQSEKAADLFARCHIPYMRPWVAPARCRVFG